MSAKELLPIAQKEFNKFIRLRDCDEYGFAKCISSGQPLKYGTANYQAGHYYPTTVQNIRFNEDNVHGQGKSDNYYKSGNQVEYRKRLIDKIGAERLEALDNLADYYKRKRHKWDRFTLLDKIETYRKKCKEIAKTKMFKV